MPFNGSGTYSPPGADFPAVSGTLIQSSKYNNVINDLATALSLCLTKDGQQIATANQPMGGFRHTNVGNASARTSYASAAQIQDGGLVLIGAIAGTDTITGSLAPAITAYASGQVFYFIPANTNSGPATININSVGAKNIFFGGAALGGGELVAGVPVAIEYDGTQFNLMSSNSLQALNIVEGRLTLTTGVPVTTSDVTAAETLFFTPYKGNRITVFDGTKWKLYAFSELSVDVPDVTQVHDVFIFDNAGTLTLEVLAWTNDTTRATALALQNGILVKSGATTRRYLGSFYCTTAGNGQTEDSLAKRYVWNYYNRVLRKGSAAFTATRSTSSTSYVELNSEIRNEFVLGVSEDAMFASSNGFHSNDTVSEGNKTSVGFDGTTAEDTFFQFGNQSLEDNPVGMSVATQKIIAAGRHYATLLGLVSGGTGSWTGGATPGLRIALQTARMG